MQFRKVRSGMYVQSLYFKFICNKIFNYKIAAYIFNRDETLKA